MTNLRYYFAFLTVLFCAFAVSAQNPGKVRIAENLSSEQKPPTAETLDSTAAEPAEKNTEPASASMLSRVGVQTAQPLTLSLNDAIKRALENNNTIEVSRTDVRYQETQLRSILGIYDPVFTIQPTYNRSSTTGSNSTGDFRANAGLTKNFKYGGFSQAFFNNTRSENAFTQSQLSSGSTSGSSSTNSAIYSSNLGFSFTQPLFRNFKTDNNRRQIRIQRKRLQQSDADFRRQTIDIISQVQRAYWDLVFSLRDQQNRLANLNLAKENLRQIEVKISAGSAAPLARAEVATELASREVDVLTASQQVSINENTLKTLLLRDATAPEWSESIVPTDAPVFSQDSINLQDAIKDAIDNRPELKRLQFAGEINKINIDYYKNQIKPQIDLVTQFSLNGLAYGGGNQTVTVTPFTSTADLALLQGLNDVRRLNGLPEIQNNPAVFNSTSTFLNGGFNRSFFNLFRTDAPNYSVGVTFSFPLRNKTAKANLAGERILQEQTDAQTRSQEQTIVAEVRNAVQAVETARRQVLAARTARENAEIQLDGERKLFDVGRSTTFLLFQRENTLTNARNSEIRAETDFNKALSDLQRATSTTFRDNGIVVESPMDDGK